MKRIGTKYNHRGFGTNILSKKETIGVNVELKPLNENDSVQPHFQHSKGKAERKQSVDLVMILKITSVH